MLTSNNHYAKTKHEDKGKKKQIWKKATMDGHDNQEELLQHQTSRKTIKTTWVNFIEEEEINNKPNILTNN
jgi:hypothetical protein